LSHLITLESKILLCKKGKKWKNVKKEKNKLKLKWKNFQNYNNKEKSISNYNKKN